MRSEFKLLFFSHCNLGLGSKPILSWIAVVSGFTYTGATSTIGDEPRRLCLAVARLASISAFSWLYSDISSILSSIRVGVLRIIATVVFCNHPQDIRIGFHFTSYRRPRQ